MKPAQLFIPQLQIHPIKKNFGHESLIFVLSSDVNEAETFLSLVLSLLLLFLSV